MSGPLLPIAVCSFCVAGLLWAETAAALRYRWLFKPLAAACFLWLALLSGATNSSYGSWLLAGLGLSWCGDVLLIPRRQDYFRAGLVSFLCGHLCYAIAFILLASTGSAGVPGFTMALLPVGLLAVLSLRWLRPHVPANMQAPVLAYLAVISVMLLCAGATLGTAPAYWITAGAWGFALSDLAVARQQFVQASVVNRYWGLPLYFAAQLMLASTPALL